MADDVREITEGEGLYGCTVCGEWFITLPIQTSCTVAHSPGSCCHYGEEAVGGRAIQLRPQLPEEHVGGGR